MLYLSERMFYQEGTTDAGYLDQCARLRNQLGGMSQVCLYVCIESTDGQEEGRGTKQARLSFKFSFFLPSLQQWTSTVRSLFSALALGLCEHLGLLLSDPDRMLRACDNRSQVDLLRKVTQYAAPYYQVNNLHVNNVCIDRPLEIFDVVFWKWTHI